MSLSPREARWEVTEELIASFRRGNNHEDAEFTLEEFADHGPVASYFRIHHKETGKKFKITVTDA